MIILVRHAMPNLEPEIDPALWTLSADGVAAARAIGPLLPAGAVLVSSDEPKAYVTLTTAAPERPVTRRPTPARGGPTAGTVQRRLPGRPPRLRRGPAARRLGAAGHRRGPHRRRNRRPPATDRPLVLAGHGMAFTTWLAAHGLIADPAAFWSDLRLPDVLWCGTGHRAHPSEEPMKLAPTKSVTCPLRAYRTTRGDK